MQSAFFMLELSNAYYVAFLQCYSLTSVHCNTFQHVGLAQPWLEAEEACAKRNEDRAV